ncbi:hypothetical protein Goarm_006449, partial [Gossypium armourianum]|nr:hypothetical protein [Gossypium armourianum]
MARQTTMDVGNALGELIAIDWKDCFGGWAEFMRLKVKIDVSKPLRRVVKLVDKEGMETIRVIKYELLPDFRYVCGLIGHSIKTCKNKVEGVGLNKQNLHYGSWLRAPTEESLTNSRDENGQPEYKGKERSCEEESLSISPMDRRNQKTIRDGMGRFKSKRKRQRGGGWRSALPRAMKIFSWNCRGVGNPATVREMEGCLAVSSEGKSGGLALLWREGVK